MSGEGLAAQKASRSAPPAPATKNKKQRIEAVDLDDDELVRRAVELRSCEASGVTLHTLRTALRQLRSDIPPAPVRDGLNSSLNAVAHSRVELASLLCFGESERGEETLLTELEGAWEFVDKPRPQHDQLQMRVVQWLWLWVRGYGVTNLGRLADLVSAAKEEDPIARDAPPNAPGHREKCRKEEALRNQSEIAEEAPGVLAGRPPAQPAAELGPRGARSQLALLPKADGDDDDDEAEETDDAVEEVDEEVEEKEGRDESMVDHAEGMQLHLSGLNKTGYKGVTHLLKRKKFRAMETGPQGKPLGYFDTAVEAAVCYARHIQSQEGPASPTASSAGVLDCAASSMSSSMSGSEPAVESGSPGGQFPLALLPAAGGGDEHDDEVEGASTQTCQICWGGASLVTTKTCN
eukprot:scaffold129535_cov63-Phaeocystis_antarctica.AAC.1